MRNAMIVVAVLAALPVLAKGTDAPYAGQDARTVSSFSQSDIDALLAGEGWGLAKPAELNGWPGPAHILELADEIELSPAQRTEIEALFAAMQAEARRLGADLIAAERALDAAFESGKIDRVRLSALLKRSETLRADLRKVHLATHIEATPILSRHQRMTYQRLRGYGEAVDGGHLGHDGGH